MILSSPFRHRCSAWLLLSLLAVVSIHAQPAPAVSSGPPLPPSPIDQFREWLSLTPDARAKALQDWPESKREILRRKIAAYESLPLVERERRLKMLELRWYMRPLMGMAPAARATALPLVPESLRPIVQERLTNWDSLAATTRAQILANDDARELVTKYYMQLQQGRTKEEILKAIPPEKRAELDHALNTWSSLSGAGRERTAAQLTAFFQLPREEQSRTLGELADGERQEMERTLSAFARLSPEQRRVCIESFQKFTRMPPVERASFLRNAARWQAMTPEERTAWKDLVTKLPPLPPVPVPLPPSPRALQPRGQVAQTNVAEGP